MNARILCSFRADVVFGRHNRRSERAKPRHSTFGFSDMQPRCPPRRPQSLEDLRLATAECTGRGCCYTSRRGSKSAIEEQSRLKGRRHQSVLRCEEVWLPATVSL